MWGIGLMFFLYLLSSIKNSDPAKMEKRVWGRLQAILKGLTSDLIPIQKEELSELSTATPETKVKKNIWKGFISTIFQEPVLAYAREELAQGGQYIAAQDSEDMLYAVRSLGEEQTVFLLNGQVFGTIDSSGIVKYESGQKGEKIFIDCNSYPEYNVIMMDETPMAYMDKLGGTSSSERFFPMINEIEKINPKLMVFLILYCKLIKTTTNS